MNASQLCDLLRFYVDHDRAQRMASAIHEDMAALGFGLVESSYTPIELWNEIGVIPQAEYSLPPNQFNIDSLEDSEAMEGSFVTCGNLLRLGQCCELGREYLSHLWPSRYSHRLLGREHLDCLNEVWWLKFWRSIEKVIPGPKASQNAPDFEWRIEIRDGLASRVVNLEVKRRTSNLNQFFKHGRPKASVAKIAKKFTEAKDGEANVAALTIFHNVDPNIDRSLRSWLDQQEFLHGLVIWTEGHGENAALKKFFKESHRWAELLIKDPAPEDTKVAGRTAGTLCTLEDRDEFLRSLAELTA